MKTLLIILLMSAPAFGQITRTVDEFTGKVKHIGAWHRAESEIKDSFVSMSAVGLEDFRAIVIEIYSDRFNMDQESHTTNVLMGTPAVRYVWQAYRIDSRYERIGIYTTYQKLYILPGQTLRNPVRIRMNGYVMTIPEQVVRDYNALP